MKKMQKFILVVVVLVSLSALALAGCSGAGTVDLSDYVTVTESGYDGYGRIYASVDFAQLLKDHADALTDESLDSQYFGDKTPELAAQFVFATYKPYVLVYNAGENLKNGDKIEFSWNTRESGIEQLSKIFKAKIKCENFPYTIQNLEPVKEIDIFDYVSLSTSGISGKGSVSKYQEAVIPLENRDTTIRIDLKIDTSKNGNLSNGDPVHLTIDEKYDAAYYAQQYGLSFKRTEADLILNNFRYYAHENPSEILEYFGDVGLENALTAIKDHVDVSREERTYTYVGAVYYYQEEGNAFTSGYNKNNQLLLIFRVDNGKVPGGWYTYLAPNNDVIIGYKNVDGSKIKTTLLDTGNPLSDSSWYYTRESYSSFNKYAHPIIFYYDDVRYVGHQTIEDCIKAFELNELKSRKYDHTIGDQVTKAYLTAQ